MKIPKLKPLALATAIALASGSFYTNAATLDSDYLTGKESDAAFVTPQFTADGTLIFDLNRKPRISITNCVHWL